MGKILIKNATIINEGARLEEDILIEGEIISSVSKKIQIDSETEVIDATGLILIPGMIDDQVHFREPGLTHKGNISSESKAAIAGGVTSYIEMPNTSPNTTTIEEFNKKISIASIGSYSNFSFMFGGTNDNLDEIKKIDPTEVAGIKLFLGSSTGKMLIDNLEVAGIKLFLGSSTGKMLIDNLNSIEKIFSSTSLTISAHCEDEQTIKNNSKKYKEIYGDNVPMECHPEIRSVEACYKSSKYATDLAKTTGARLNVFHISTQKEIDLFDNKLPVEEKKITAEVCAHHLWFTDKDYKKLGSKIKWNPAIKSQSDKNALWNAIKEDKIDIIASDHAPHTVIEKENSYFNCPSGGPMVQHTILSLLEESPKHGVSIEKIVEKISHNPAKIFNINKRGFIKEGYYADIVLIDPNSPTLVSKKSLLYKCGWSPFEGVTFTSSIHSTILNGRVVYSDGKVNETPYGKKLVFDR